MNRKCFLSSQSNVNIWKWQYIYILYTYIIINFKFIHLKKQISGNYDANKKLSSSFCAFNKLLKSSCLLFSIIECVPCLWLLWLLSMAMRGTPMQCSSAISEWWWCDETPRALMIFNVKTSCSNKQQQLQRTKKAWHKKRSKKATIGQIKLNS